MPVRSRYPGRNSPRTIAAAATTTPAIDTTFPPAVGLDDPLDGFPMEPHCIMAYVKMRTPPTSRQTSLLRKDKTMLSAFWGGSFLGVKRAIFAANPRQAAPYVMATYLRSARENQTASIATCG